MALNLNSHSLIFFYGGCTPSYGPTQNKLTEYEQLLPPQKNKPVSDVTYASTSTIMESWLYQLGIDNSCRISQLTPVGDTFEENS